jgi:hypothetical protein
MEDRPRVERGEVHAVAAAYLLRETVERLSAVNRHAVLPEWAVQGRCPTRIA